MQKSIVILFFLPKKEFIRKLTSFVQRRTISEVCDKLKSIATKPKKYIIKMLTEQTKRIYWLFEKSMLIVEVARRARAEFR